MMFPQDFHYRKALSADSETRGTHMRAVQDWLWKSQTWPDDTRQKYQFERLQVLLQHAQANVPFYRRLFKAAGIDVAAPLSPDRWRRIPLLTRRDIQTAGAEMHAKRVPSAHGQTFRSLTGGSTGQPVLTIGTELTTYAWQTFALRDHFWHERDFSLKLASIRHTPSDVAAPPDGMLAKGWGPSVSPFVKTGPGAALTVKSTVEQQVDWLLRQQPEYLLGYPSCIAAVARRFLARGQTLSSLREVRTFGEVVDPIVSELCNEAWGVKVVDLYSSQELGYIALQCPTCSLYHVQEENVRLELLAPDGTPCQPGEIGKIVITALHNFAMPLIRYDLGDYAEAGDACACGRTLATLKRIMGRQRNMLILPNGDQVWPALSLDQEGAALPELASIHQMQIVQKTVFDLEVKVVTDNRLTGEGENRLKQFIDSCLPCPFNILVKYVDQVERSPTRKFEDFRSEVVAA